MRTLVVMFLVWVVMLTGCSKEESIPRVNKGEVDFSEFSLSSTNHSYMLSGDWLFAPDTLVDPEQSWPEASAEYLTVPKSWEFVPYLNGKEWGREFGTYRLQIRLHPDDVGKTLGLKISPIASSFRMWIDGRLLKEVGAVGTTVSTAVPHESQEYVFFTPQSSKLQMDIQVSNFAQRKGGIWNDIYMGDQEAIRAKSLPPVVRDCMSAGALLMMGLFYLVFASLYITDRSTLFLGLLSISLGLRTFLFGEVLVTFFFPDLLWEWKVKLEYFIEIAAILALNQYLRSIFPEHFSKNVLRFTYMIFGLFALFVLFTPAIIFTQCLTTFTVMITCSLLYSSFLVYARAVKHRRLGARSGAIAGIIAFFAVLSDSFYYLSIPLTSEGLINTGFFIYLLTQMAVTVRRYISLKQDSAALTMRLAESNEELEHKVMQRTRQLTESYRFNSRLLHNIVHDLNAPIALIRQQTKLLQVHVQKDGINHLTLIEQQSEWAVRLAQNLNDLARLQENKMNFQPSSMSMEEMLRFLYKRTEPIIRGGGFKWSHKALDELFEAVTLVVNIDLFLMERVFDNITSNMLKYALPDGNVSLSYAKRETVLEIIFENEVASLSDETLDRMFDRFYQQGPEEGGSGIGLAVCKEIVRLHGGQIHVDQPEKERLQVVISLPIMR
ncbi:Histidine kinase-, DNA gyrase B-, and HSP90-like ATPase [Paenibacillus sp. 1_12]|uniref:sensor histidine kinase n=1 Tax=Paenibacillus sp. 1_12 TaxID=1566278 RepID=UPI0008E966DB|nr:sensor histidine kinase [Paenibacillus sp. 1_12]SFK93831.1 Histidine kinase-, DNA gyrase B-, and HSP90-like ATPase [Paenibacillus sp. 1_12]